MLEVITENIDIVEEIAVVALTGLIIAMSVRILWLAGVISFKFTNPGVGK